jgi:predicted nucleic acid-binding protein
MIALLRQASTKGVDLRVPAGAMAQAWRNGTRQAVLARFLRAREVQIKPLDEHLARACGELCAAAGTADIVDASVVLVAREHGDVVLSSDVDDLTRLDPKLSIESI